MPTLRLEALEGRDAPAAAIDQPYEAFAFALINELRQDPAGFATELDHLRRGTDAAFGYSANDPVAADLRNLINGAARPANYSAAIRFLRATPAVGPLGWDATLADRAAGHNDWMRGHAFEHTATDATRKAYLPNYNTGYKGGNPDAWGLGSAWTRWGEDIGYTYGLLAHSKAALKAGRIGLVEFQERAAFIDTISYVVEVNSPNLAHLKNVMASDVGGYNAIGLDIDLYEGPGEVRDKIGEATVSTHRFGLTRPGGTGGYITGLVYRDGNSNDSFDAGEGIAATVSIAGPNGTVTESIDSGSRGVYSRYVANGTYSITAKASDGSIVGTRTVTISNRNAWAAFQSEGSAPSEVPVNIAASGATTGLRPTISWNAPAGAFGYEVRLTDRTTGRFIYRTLQAGTSWSPPRDLVSGHDYRAIVRAQFAYHDGPWSELRDFTVERPRITAPTSDTTDLRPTIAWTSVGGATAYDVRLVNVSNRALVSQVRVTGTSWEVARDLAIGKTYRVWARAVGADGVGMWSERVDFKIV